MVLEYLEPYPATDSPRRRSRRVQPVDISEQPVTPLQRLGVTLQRLAGELHSRSNVLDQRRRSPVVSAQLEAAAEHEVGDRPQSQTRPCVSSSSDHSLWRESCPTVQHA